MAQKPDLYERVDGAVAEGKLWRAKEILQGNIATRGYDTKLFERYGQLLMQMGDLIEAGKYLFLSAAREPEYEEAIALYLGRHTRKDPHNLVSTFPQVARLRDVNDYPVAVRQKLRELGIKSGEVATAARRAPSRHPRTEKAVVIGFCLLLVVFVAFLCVVFVAGFVMVLEWLF